MPPESESLHRARSANGSAFRLVVFDWDGTLLDSVGSILGCTHATLDELGLPRVDDSRVRGALGLGLRECVEALAPGCDEEVFHSILDGYGRHWQETYSHEASLFPGSRETLDTLERNGCLLAIATAKSRPGLEADLETTGLSNRFHATRTIDESPSKPAPEMLLQITEELGARIDETLLVGDSVHDLEMAHNAGTAAIGVCSGSQPRDILEALAPLVVLDSVAELVAWLGVRAEPMTSPGANERPART